MWTVEVQSPPKRDVEISNVNFYILNFLRVANCKIITEDFYKFFFVNFGCDQYW